MATTDVAPAHVEAPAPRSRNVLLEWLTTVDHKRIGILYLLLTAFFFLIGGLMALAIRIQLESSSGTALSPERYDQVFTMHGTTMVFLFAVPIMAAFGNYIVPLQIGARDMAFPRLNAASFWLLDGPVSRGYLGVDGFFVLSGLILAHAHPATGTPWRFWARRSTPRPRRPCARPGRRWPTRRGRG